MREDSDNALETLIAICVLAAVLTQTWILVQEATQGDAGRTVQRWWAQHGRPQVVRLVAWLDAAALTETMLTDEVVPYLERQADGT